MDTNASDLHQQFPELKNPALVVDRIATAFVAPEYARAAFGLMRVVIDRLGTRAGIGTSTVMTAPHDYDNLVMTVGKWWFLNFHIAPTEALEDGDDVEAMVPLDYETILERQKGEENANGVEKNGAETVETGEAEQDELEDDEEIIEATFYQVGTFLFDSTIIPHETIFDREDMDCYAYDYPEERIEAERFYWARLVWEPEDLREDELIEAVVSSAEFILNNHGTDTPFAEFHEGDFESLLPDKPLCDRIIAAADFGDVIEIKPEE